MYIYFSQHFDVFAGHSLFLGSLVYHLTNEGKVGQCIIFLRGILLIFTQFAVAESIFLFLFSNFDLLLRFVQIEGFDVILYIYWENYVTQLRH